MDTGSAVDVEAGLEVAAAPQWLIVACDGRCFAIALERVSAIVPPQPATRMPGCGPHVCGLIGVRGRVITAFDLGALLGSRPSALAKDYRLLLVEHGARRIGLAVDEVRLAAGMELGVAAAAELRETGLEPADVLGRGRIANEVVFALDTDHIFGRLLV